MRKIVLSIFIIACMFAFGAAVKTKAGTDDSARGWIWGGGAENDGSSPWDGTNTNFGWTSANSVNCDIDGDKVMDRVNVGEGTGDAAAPAGCPADGAVVSDYGVDIPEGNGSLSGYGWSENLGWISFQDSAGCPSGGDCNARRDGNNLKGWARIMSIPQAGTNAGGWQGWISLNSKNCDSDGNGWLDAACGGTNDNLSGAVSDYGVSIDGSTGKLSGFAWSDELGWLDFSRVSTGPDAATPPESTGTPQCVPGYPTLDCTKSENCNQEEEVPGLCMDANGNISDDFSACGEPCPSSYYKCDNKACEITPGQWREVQP